MLFNCKGTNLYKNMQVWGWLFFIYNFIGLGI